MTASPAPRKLWRCLINSWNTRHTLLETKRDNILGEETEGRAGRGRRGGAPAGGAPRGWAGVNASEWLGMENLVQTPSV